MTATPSPSTRDDDVVEQLDALIARIGGDPGSLSGRLVREMMQTSLRLITDGADLGEQKLIARSFKELRYALKVFRAYRGQHKVSIFGSARTPPGHPDYQAAVDVAKGFAEHDWMVITGAGDGIMRAGHEGAGKAKSFGVSIRLPFETNANSVIAGDPKLITFRYFFTRKLCFVSQADALVLLPGGFGTLDEAFEVLTLVQTGKSAMIPIVMVEPPGNDYFERLDRYVQEVLLKQKLISPPDLHLYHIFHDPKAAVQHVIDFYRNYHSMRYVDDQLVIRIRKPLAERQLAEMNEEFADLRVTGVFEQSGPLPEETTELDLPRIVFTYTRRDYGRLRLLIDRINQFAM